MIDVAWLVDHLGAILDRTIQHIYLAAIAVIIGFGISFALAIVSVRRRVLYAPVTAFAGILYTIPSLAMFAALVPVTGLTIATAEVPLVLYTILIFVRNIVAGIDSVPPEVVEAADGMGFTPLRRLREVELPLAIPLIVAGIRLASVSTIGLVTISGIIGDRFGGLGFFIFEGYRHSFPTEIFAGALPSVLLAIAVDLVLARVETRATPWRRFERAQQEPAA